MHIRNNALLLALLVALCEPPYLVHAQNTFTPDPIQHYYPSFWNDDVFAERVPAFARRRVASKQELYCMFQQ